MATIYPKEHTMEDFHKTQQMREGNVIKVDTAQGKCVGVFISLKEGFMKPFWNLSLSPKYIVRDNKVSNAKGYASDFTIVSPFKRVTVLASDLSTWDGKEGLLDASPSSRRSSNEDIPRDTLNRTSSCASLSSLGSVSPINADDMRASKEFTQNLSPRRKIELQTFLRKSSET